MLSKAEFKKELHEAVNGPIYLGEESFPIFYSKHSSIPGYNVYEDFKPAVMASLDKMYEDYLSKDDFDQKTYFDQGWLEFLDSKLEVEETEGENNA